ncbi:hypothetical protein PlfCFBP13513_14830 [Plantibacter flavus]|uniref:COG4705 family protein n=1 Tax=Plantibacter TaxID=190323 RepID=UPI0010C1C96A|nr:MULTISPECIES: hypothetical protein [Plantibacter]MBD8103772.1 hypothetical protein [Plantibacter sp. CFBP 8775]MBD8467221.1 hypothetical protein [Plantibacter sp. CFBP 8798]MBD8535574.1 hypothetical protein [Plantibacter sp. CFBP 13570]TKJ96704.1 hypothetical protein PlfCFBP13513_14830 [Plantibacter flavus]
MTSTLESTRVSDLLLSKVPQITLAFWVIKVFSTTVGETAADYFNDTLGFGLTATSIVTGALFLIALAVQFRTRRYVPTVYWITVVLISVVGTLITDNLTDVVGVPLWASTLGFAVLLGATFTVWFRRERTLSIHSIVTRRREAFYWLAILFTFALGTAAGDFLSEALGLGYVLAAVLFAAVIAAVAIAYVVFHANAVVCFWIAYVLTRPLGASLGDLASQPVADGGLGLGTTATSAVFGIVIIALVVFMTVQLARQRRQLVASDPSVVSAVAGARRHAAS